MTKSGFTSLYILKCKLCNQHLQDADKHLVNVAKPEESRKRMAFVCGECRHREFDEDSNLL